MNGINSRPSAVRIQRYFEMLLRAYSPSKHERATADVIKHVLNELNVSYVEDDTAVHSGSDTGNIITGGQQHPRVTFCAHMDTIRIYQKNDYIIEEGVVRGKGGGVIGIDDKCGVAILLEAIACMKDEGGIPEDIRFLFTTCEEEGFYGAQYIDASHFIHAYNFVVDSGGLPIGRIVNHCASQYDFEVLLIGEMSHTGNPDGPHALLMSAELIRLLKTGRTSDNTFVNLSDLHCDGNDNTIPGRTVLRGQILSFDDVEAQSILCEMDDVVGDFFVRNGLKGGLTHTCKAPGFRSSQDIIDHARKAALAAGLPFSLGRTGAGSDAHVFAHRGAKALKISCGMMNVHSNDEYVKLDDLLECAQFVLSLAEDYSTTL